MERKYEYSFLNFLSRHRACSAETLNILLLVFFSVKLGREGKPKLQRDQVLSISTFIS